MTAIVSLGKNALFRDFYFFKSNLLIPHKAAGAASICYLEKLMLFKRELMLLKCQISTNTNKNGFLLPTK